MRATAYPAVCGVSGRRARDVIPAAARALVRTITSVEKAVVMFWSKRWAANPRTPRGGMQRELQGIEVALARVTRWSLYTFVIPGPPTRSGSGTWNRWLCASGVVQRRRRWAARSKRDVAAGHWAKPIPDRATRVRN